MSYNPRSHSAWHRVIRNPTFQHPTFRCLERRESIISSLIIHIIYIIYNIYNMAVIVPGLKNSKCWMLDVGFMYGDVCNLYHNILH